MSRSLEYSGSESDREYLESKRGQDLVANLVDIRTGSMVHWWLAFITTGDYCYGYNTKSTAVPPVTPVMSPELICYSRSSS